MKFNGLTDKEVDASREKYGSNAIPDSRTHHVLGGI